MPTAYCLLPNAFPLAPMPLRAYISAKFILT